VFLYWVTSGRRNSIRKMCGNRSAWCKIIIVTICFLHVLFAGFFVGNMFTPLVSEQMKMVPLIFLAMTSIFYFILLMQMNDFVKRRVVIKTREPERNIFSSTPQEIM